jgi:hypothetical protein
MTERPQQPDLHMPGWPELRFYGKAETAAGDVWWYEDRMGDGSIKRHPLQPYKVAVGCHSP